MSSIKVTGRTIEKTKDGRYILRTSTGMMKLGRVNRFEDREAPVKPLPKSVHGPGFGNRPMYRRVGSAHKVEFTDEQYRYFISEHNNQGRSWLNLAAEAKCSDATIRKLCVDWCALHMPEEYDDLRQRPKVTVIIDEDEFARAYVSEDIPLKTLAQRYGIGESRANAILRKKLLVK